MPRIYLACNREFINFVVNRVAAAMTNEWEWIWDEGLARCCVRLHFFEAVGEPRDGIPALT
jgi:hypothetical protein